MEVSLDDLHAAVELELILDLNKIVTCSGINTAWLDLNGDGDEVVNDLLEDVPDTVLADVAVDGWVEHDCSLAVLEVLKVHSDFEDWRVAVDLVVLDVDLIGEVLH